MRIDDDSFSKQVQQHQHLQQNSEPSWRTPAPDFQKRDPASANRHVTAGRILLALTALIIVTLIVSATVLLVGESRRQRQSGQNGGVTANEAYDYEHDNEYEHEDKEENLAAFRTRRHRQPPNSISARPPPPIDDDEINDAEIYKAVVQSMAEWSKVAKKKAEQKEKERQRLQAVAAANNTDTALVLSRQKRDEEIVCYGELGCFRDEGPFDYLDMLPSPPEEVSTKFLLYTRKNMHAPQIYSYFNFTTMLHSHGAASTGSLAVPPPPATLPAPAMSPPAPVPVPVPVSGSANSKNQGPGPHAHTHAPQQQQPCTFNASHPTKIIIHGFGSTCNQMWASEIRLSILAMTETNVICVDWENGAALPNYVRAAVNTRLVGKQVAMLIFWLNKHFGSDTKDFHLIGFSLGAHVAGFAGQDLKNLSRITGLDPAGPLFESYDPKVRLDSSDALFVDVIHSNGDSLLMGGLGSWEPMGHVDFYPNGGRVQKGCSNLFLGAVRDFLWAASDGDGRSLCNHRRAYKFFTESVSPKCSFPAFTCDSYDKFLTGACFSWDANRCGNMGYYADQMPVQSKGILYLLTREDEPFCANQYRITVESSPSPVPITTYGGLEAVVIGSDYVNETFLITQTVKDSMVAGAVLQKLIVAHPAITEPIQIQLKYTAYQGWLYSGIARWSMDSLIITNAYGKSMSFCTRLLLPNGIPVTIRLTPGICINRYTEPTGVTPPSGSNAIGPGSGSGAARPGLMPPAPGASGGFPHGQVNGYEGNVNSITENSTFVHSHASSAQNAAAIAADLELSLMKPPRVVFAGGGAGAGQQAAVHSSGQSEEIIGPTYLVTSGGLRPPTAQATAVATDWSQWHPVQPPAAWAAKHKPNRTSMRYGTPVVLSPPVSSSEEQHEREREEATTEEGVTIASTTDSAGATETEKLPNGNGNGSMEDSTVPTAPQSSASTSKETATAAEPGLEGAQAQRPQGLDKIQTQTGNQTVSGNFKTNTTTTNAKANETTTTKVNSTRAIATLEEHNPTDLSLTESMDLPVSIQICHFVDGDGSSSTESSIGATNGSQRMACVYPQEKLQAPSPSESESETEVMSNNALGQIHSFQHIVDAELGGANSTGVSTSKTRSTTQATAAVTSETQKISVLKQELHAQGHGHGPGANGNSNGNNDPDAMPPHLHYILQQLENEGLGPPGGSMVHGYGGYGHGSGGFGQHGHGPGPIHMMNGNALGHGARSLGGPNFHDNHIQTDFVGGGGGTGRQMPVVYYPNYALPPPHAAIGHAHGHAHPFFPAMPHDPGHFVPFLQPHPAHGHAQGHNHGGHSKNPAVLKYHTNNRSGGGKTPTPSSRALKHRPVALTHGHAHAHAAHGAPSQSQSNSPGGPGPVLGSGRRSKLIDVSTISLTSVSDTGSTFQHPFNYPPPNAYRHGHAMGPMLSLTLPPSAIPPPPAASPSPAIAAAAAAVQDNVMLASTTNEQHQHPHSAFIPRRHSTLSFRPSRPAPPSSSGQQSQSQPPAPIFYMTNANTNNAKLQHQHQQPRHGHGHFLFHGPPPPPREFVHQPQQQQRSSTSNGPRRSLSVGGPSPAAPSPAPSAADSQQ